jgi:hypothetical protein
MKSFLFTHDDTVGRAVAVIALMGVALIHLLDLPGTFQTQAYKGVLYVLLIAGCLGASALLLRGDDRRGWWAALLLPAGAALGYVISRTVGIPGGADDIGNWAEPLGIASLFVEASLVALAGAALVAVEVPQLEGRRLFDLEAVA